MYPVFVVGIYCKDCVIVRECVKSQAIEARRVLVGSSQLSIPQSEDVPCTWLKCEELVQMETAVFRKYLASKAFPRDTCETFCYAKLYYLIYTFCTHTIYTHIIHKW